MATVTIGHRPDLTKERVQEIFSERFADKYEIVRSTALKRDFIVKESKWTGVGVRFKQESDGDSVFVFTALMPNALLRTLFSGLVSYALLRKSWRRLEMEIMTFIRVAPEFQQRAKAA